MATGTEKPSPAQTPDDGLGEPARVPKQSLRTRIRANPALYQPYRVGVFVVGLLCIAVGVALAALPGPLTIPPMLLGLWIWSSEFAFAKRLFDAMKVKANQAWDHAKAHPVSSALITIGGIAGAIAAFWAIQHFELIDRAKNALG
jgi:uncharacterized membrane protein YbaN (DUF454 family)